VTARLGAAFALLVLALGGWVLAAGTPAFDEPIARALGSLRGAPQLWRGVTWLGDWPMRLLVGFGASLWLWRRRSGLAALVLLATVALQTLSNSALKAIFARPRPEVFDHLDYTWDLSFPSGHAAQNACLWALVVLLVDRRLAWIGVPLALAIGLSRVILGVHWPSDVIGGWMEGVAFALIGAEIVRRRERA
jgi:undecaprenyl-diphosphatase